MGNGGWDFGLSVEYMRELVEYWRHQYDWRAAERGMNTFAQYQTQLDGRRVHFIHERGRGQEPLPIVLTHGFPDSFLRFAKLIPMLTDPASHGGDPNDSFDVVAPSLPGFAFSDPGEEVGTIFRVGDVWHRLMTETLGYGRYAAHGGDWGSLVTELIGRDHANAVVGIHLTDVPFYHAFRKPDDATAKEKKYLEGVEKFGQREGAYALIQGAAAASAGARAQRFTGWPRRVDHREVAAVERLQWRHRVALHEGRAIVERDDLALLIP